MTRNFKRRGLLFDVECHHNFKVASSLLLPVINLPVWGQNLHPKPLIPNSSSPSSCSAAGTSPSMPTLPDYPRVSWIQTESHALLYMSPNLPDNRIKEHKINFSAIVWLIFGIFEGKFGIFDAFLGFNWYCTCRSLL